MSTQSKTPDRPLFVSKELELPDTLFVRDVDNRVFQNIVARTLSTIKDIALIEGGFMHNILGRSGPDNIKGIYAEQDQQNRSLKIRIELNIGYGVPIPSKVEEIQSEVIQRINEYTGLHVASIHVIVKDLIPLHQCSQAFNPHAPQLHNQIDEEFADELK